MDQSSDCDYDEEVGDDEAIPTVVVKSDSDDENKECNCIVEYLLVKPFKDREYHEQFNIISNGRPMPPMNGLTTKTRVCTRRFKLVTYKFCKWLCGCEKTLKLYCWACILFSDEINLWTSIGISDLNNLHNLLKRHEMTASHISAMLSLASFGSELNTNFKMDTCKFNQMVKKNRHVVTKLIDVTCLLAELELPFNSDYETTLRKSNFVEFVNLLRNYDDNLDTHISNSNYFAKFSGDLQNDLIDSIYQVVVDEIKGLLDDAEFVALTLIETPNIGKKCQIATVLRFCDEDGNVHERFLGFTEFPHNSLLDSHILNMINDLKISSRLISISFNGPSFVSPKNSFLMAKIRYQHPGICLVHYFSHNMFFNLKNVVDHIGECKLFFWTLIGLASFFSKCTQGNFALHQEIRKRHPSHNSVKWDLNCKLARTVLSHQAEIINILESMVDTLTKWDMNTYNSAKGFCSALQDFDFNFLLNLFGDISPRAELLFHLLEEKEFDTAYYLKGIEDFKKHLDKLRDNYDEFWSHLISNYDMYDTRGIKRTKVEDKKDKYFQLFLDVIDNIQNKMNYERLKDIEHLNFTPLLNTGRFQKFVQNFPNKSLLYLKKSVYGRLFDMGRLNTELGVVYKDLKFHKRDVYELYKYLCVNKLNEIIPEVCKLANLIVTLPLAPASSDAAFSASKRIEKYQDQCQAEDTPTSLSLLSIEKTFLSALKRKPLFYDKVINRFGSKIRHIELSYKE